MKLIPRLYRHQALLQTRRAFSTNHHNLRPSPTSSNFPDQTLSLVTSISSNPCYSLLSLCNDLISLRNIHAQLIIHGLSSNLLCQTKLVSLYGSFGELHSARSIFDRIPNPDLYSFKVMIRWYFLNNLHLETLMLYNCMRKCVNENDDVIFSILLKACSELRCIDEGRKLHCLVVKLGSHDSFVSTGLVDMYANCEETESARTVFDEIDKGMCNVVTWTSLISGYVQNDCPDEALNLFNRMREGLVEGNEFTLGCLLKACGQLGAIHQGKWLHGYMIKSRIQMNSFVATALLDMYVKCSSRSIDGDAAAQLVFDQLSVNIIDVVLWTAMIVGYTQCGQPDKALTLFIDKRWVNHLRPNFVTLSTVLSACAALGNVSMGRSVHGLANKLGLNSQPPVQHSLVHLYMKCRVLRDAWCVFSSIKDKDVISWNSIISGYVQNGESLTALQLFHQMMMRSVFPDAITCATVISACASITSLNAIQIGCSFHSFFLKVGIQSTNAYVGTSLLNFYAKCGDTVSARRVFDEMGEEKNAVTFSALISGYGMYGEADESLALFGDMLRCNVEPNEVIFTTILSACSHTGKVGEGWRCFESMCREYNMTPEMKHYACVVDMLSRAGRVEEALDFIKEMPTRPDATVFGAFLHGCELHSEFEIGDMAVERMLSLYPDEACYYVLISKYYASNGRWDRANEVRDLMKRRGLSKSPGWSYGEMDVSKELSPPSVVSIR